jgi:Amt family ammonium transporter
VFKQQVTTDVFVQDIFYAICVLGVFPGVGALALFDAGLGRLNSVLDAWVQKLVAGFVTAAGFSIIGYGVWYWQYDQAFGVPDAFHQAISTW